MSTRPSGFCPAEDFLADFLRHVAQIEADDAELNDGFCPRFQQDDFAIVKVAVEPPIQNADVNRRAVIRLHRHRHVVIVGQHAAVWLRQRLRRNVLGIGQQRLVIGKQIDERLEFVVRIHGFSGAKDGEGTQV